MLAQKPVKIPLTSENQLLDPKAGTGQSPKVRKVARSATPATIKQAVELPPSRSTQASSPLLRKILPNQESAKAAHAKWKKQHSEGKSKPQVNQKPAVLESDVQIDLPQSYIKSLLNKIKGFVPTNTAGNKTQTSGQRILSLDIGRTSVKLVELIKSSKEVTLIAADYREIPANMRKNKGSLKVLLTKFVREMLPVERIKGAQLHLALPNKSTQTRKLSMPMIQPKDRENAIKFQIKKELPFPLEVCVISYRGWDNKLKGRQDVQVVSVDRRAIDERLSILDDAGVFPDHITASTAAMHFLLHQYSEFDMDSGAVALVDIDSQTTTISIFKKEALIMSRTISTGGDEFTSVLDGLNLGQGGSELDFDSAEKYKIKHGLPTGSDPSSMRVAILMRPLIEKLATEIMYAVRISWTLSPQ